MKTYTPSKLTRYLNNYACSHFFVVCKDDERSGSDFCTYWWQILRLLLLEIPLVIFVGVITVWICASTLFVFPIAVMELVGTPIYDLGPMIKGEYGIMPKLSVGIGTIGTSFILMFIVIICVFYIEEFISNLNFGIRLPSLPKCSIMVKEESGDE